jgi:hypothetical protein
MASAGYRKRVSPVPAESATRCGGSPTTAPKVPGRSTLPTKPRILWLRSVWSCAGHLAGSSSWPAVVQRLGGRVVGGLVR